LARSYYQVLGVPADASTDEIERAFKAAARRVHPDLHGGDGAAEERMKELNQIRATLTDAAARAAYDVRLRAERSRPSAPRPAPQPAPEPWSPPRGAAWMNVKADDARRSPRPPPPSFRVADPPTWRARFGLLWTRLPGSRIARGRPTLGSALDVGFLLLCVLFAFIVLRLVIKLRLALPLGD
jgi:curved DNA-binding protein CbpA